MKSKVQVVVATSILTLFVVLCTLALGAPAQSARTFIPYADARPIFDAVRADFVPPDLRDLAPAEREAGWPAWIVRHDTAIRARVAEGDADSIVHLLLFGTSFTGAPRASERDLAALVARPDEALRALRRRIDDFAAALAAPGANERLRFARAVVERQGVDPATAEGRAALGRYLDERTRVVGGSVTLTLFRDRGLATDTSIVADFGIEQALDAMKAAGAVRAGSVRRVAIVGPGLDFIDKLDGYDFYPEQTIQPFALIDSLLRLELAEPDRLEVVALDLGARVLQHVEGARARARAGMPYTVVLPRNTARPWSPELVDYWDRLGNWIGEPAPRVPAAPPNAGAVAVRALSIRPPSVLSIAPIDANIVTERLGVQQAPFDLIVATNILLYYDVFDQSLAAANIADMLRAGGVLLTNNRIVELPGSPLTAAGYIDVGYMTPPGIGQTGDRITWYRRSR